MSRSWRMTVYDLDLAGSASIKGGPLRFFYMREGSAAAQHQGLIERYDPDTGSFSCDATRLDGCGTFGSTKWRRSVVRLSKTPPYRLFCRVVSSWTSAHRGWCVQIGSSPRPAQRRRAIRTAAPGYPAYFTVACSPRWETISPASTRVTPGSRQGQTRSLEPISQEEIAPLCG